MKRSGGMKRPPLCDKEGALKRDEVQCPICWSILIQPVTMPCRHALCLECFKKHVEETSLQCPCCRVRLSVWSRRANKDGKLLDVKLWNRIQKEFPKLVETRLCGQDSQMLEPLDFLSLADRDELQDCGADTAMELCPIGNGEIDGVTSTSKGDMERELEAMVKQHQDIIENERRQEKKAGSEIIEQLQDAREVPQPVDPSTIETDLVAKNTAMELCPIGNKDIDGVTSTSQHSKGVMERELEAVVKQHQDNIENERRQEEIAGSELIEQLQDAGEVPQPVDPSTIETDLVAKNTAMELCPIGNGEIDGVTSTSQHSKGDMERELEAVVKQHQDNIENERRQEEIAGSELIEQLQDAGGVPQPVDPSTIETDLVAKKLAQELEVDLKARRLAEINASTQFFSMPSQTPSNKSASSSRIIHSSVPLVPSVKKELVDFLQNAPTRSVNGCTFTLKREFLNESEDEEFPDPSQLQADETADRNEDNNRELVHFELKKQTSRQPPKVAKPKFDPNSSRLLGVPSRRRTSFDPNSSCLLGIRSRKSLDPNSSRLLGIRSRKSFDPNSSRILGIATRRSTKKIKAARSSVAGLKAEREKQRLERLLKADRKLAERMQKLLDTGKDFTPPRGYLLRTRRT